MKTCAFIVCFSLICHSSIFSSTISPSLSPLSSVSYRRHLIIKNKIYLNCYHGYSGLWHHTSDRSSHNKSGVLSLETIQTLQRVFSVEPQPKKLQYSRETVSGRVEKDRQRQGGGGGGKESKHVRESRHFPFSPTEWHAAEKASSTIHLWLSDEIICLRLVSALKDTQRQCHRDNLGRREPIF